MSLHKTRMCVVKSPVKIAAVSWHSLRRFVKPAPGIVRRIRISHRTLKPSDSQKTPEPPPNRNAACRPLTPCARSWPMSAGFRFPEFLLRRCQYEHVQDYVRLTRDWCEWNVSAGRFLLAHSYLNTGWVGRWVGGSVGRWVGGSVGRWVGG